MSDIFFDMEDNNKTWDQNKSTEKNKSPEQNKKEHKPLFLMSSDSFSSCGLDLVFEMTKEAWFDWIDLAIWKNFDSRNVDYVKKLSAKHDLPIKVIQVSENVNQKELNKALDLCEATWADTITINAPKYFNTKSFNFITDNIAAYKKDNKQIHFSIINPEDWNMFGLPIPKYRFTNIIEIIKKIGCYLGLDISNFDTDVFENDFMRKLSNFLPYISVLYFSDRNRLWEWHLLPGEWSLKIESLLKKIKQIWYGRYFSTKININKIDLSDSEKLASILKKTRKYYQENFEELEIDE